MNFRRIATPGILILAVVAAAFGWIRFVAHPKPVACGYCSRPLHANSIVTAEIDGKRTQVCCLRCAITEANQLRKPLRVITVHDYSTGAAILSPETAWYVEGSRVMPCEHGVMHMDEAKKPQTMVFDRCSPGTMAFATRQQAEDFTETNGGATISFGQLMSEAHYQ